MRSSQVNSSQSGVTAAALHRKKSGVTLFIPANPA